MSVVAILITLYAVVLLLTYKSRGDGLSIAAYGRLVKERGRAQLEYLHYIAAPEDAEYAADLSERVEALMREMCRWEPTIMDAWEEQPGGREGSDIPHPDVVEMYQAKAFRVRLFRFLCEFDQIVNEINAFDPQSVREGLGKLDAYITAKEPVWAQKLLKQDTPERSPNPMGAVGHLLI